MTLSGDDVLRAGEPEEGTPAGQIRQLQFERLRWSVRHAWQNVPHYQRSFAAQGVHPDDLRTLEDLARFPFLTKQDFRANYPFGLFAVPRRRIARIHTSSGTTGKPTVVGYTSADLAIWGELMSRCIRAAGARTGDIVHIAYDYGLFTGGLDAHIGGLSPCYNLETAAHGPLDALTVHVEALEREFESAAQRRAVAQELTRRIKRTIGVTVTVVAHPPGTLKRSAGMALRAMQRAQAR